MDDSAVPLIQGNLLLLGGFGNLRGNVEIWSEKERKEVAKFDAPDSTDVRSDILSLKHDGSIFRQSSTL